MLARGSDAEGAPRHFPAAGVLDKSELAKNPPKRGAPLSMHCGIESPSIHVLRHTRAMLGLSFRSDRPQASEDELEVVCSPDGTTNLGSRCMPLAKLAHSRLHRSVGVWESCKNQIM